MAKPKYWTNLFLEDDDETNLGRSGPLIGLNTATRAIDDTAIRSIFWAELTATVTLTAPIPDPDWLAAASVSYLIWFDTESAGTAVAFADNNPGQMGWVDLALGPLFQTSATKYTVRWQTPSEGIDLEGSRQGSSISNLPSVSFQQYVQDNRGVFFNFTGFHVQFSSVLRVRTLWASNLPGA